MRRSKEYYFWAVLVWKWVWLSGERSQKLINLFLFPATGANNRWERKRNMIPAKFYLFIFVKLTSVHTDAYATLNHVQGQVWKRVWIFEARSENGCGIFWSEIGSRFIDAGGTSPPKIPRSTPPPPPPPPQKIPLMLIICAWSVNLNAICEIQIRSGIRPNQRFSEHKDSAGRHREEQRLTKDSQFLTARPWAERGSNV